MTQLALSSSPAGRIKWSASYSRYLSFGYILSCILCINRNLLIDTQSAFYVQDVSILKRFWRRCSKAISLGRTLGNVWTTIFNNIPSHCLCWWHYKFHPKHYLQILVSMITAYNRPHLLKNIQNKMPKQILHHLWRNLPRHDDLVLKRIWARYTMLFSYLRYRLFLRKVKSSFCKNLSVTDLTRIIPL